MKLIAFCAPKESGKTEAANYLVKYHGYRRLSFADPLRAMLLALGLSPHELRVAKEQPIFWLGGRSPRQLLQSLGTEWGRQMVDPDTWVNALARQLRDIEAAHERRILRRLRLVPELRIVIDDCRFDNEARMIHAIGGKLIAIVRPGKEKGTHASERGVSPEHIDAVVHNAGPLPKLYGEVAKSL